MDKLVEELQLLGLWEEGKDIKTQKIKFASQFSKAVRGLVDLYHQTFQEKNGLEESFARQAAEIRELQDANHQLKVKCSKQATLISNLKFKEENLLAKIETSSREQDWLRKKGVEERLKWQRRSQLEKIALQKVHQEVSSLKDELRKIVCTASSKTKKNGELLVEAGSIQIINNHLKVDPEIQEKRKSFKEEVLGKSIRRLDASQRLLIEESASISSSLQVINTSIQHAINALKMYSVQVDKHVSRNSLGFKNEAENRTATWLPLLVTNTHQMCAELNELVEALIKTSSCDAVGVAGGAVRKYMHSFCSYESVLDSAVESICLK